MPLGMAIGGYPSAPTEANSAQLKELSATVEMLTNQLNDFIKVKIPELNKLLKEYDLKPLKAPKEVKL